MDIRCMGPYACSAPTRNRTQNSKSEASRDIRFTIGASLHSTAHALKNQTHLQESPLKSSFSVVYKPVHTGDKGHGTIHEVREIVRE